MTEITAQPSEFSYPSLAVLLCLGEHNDVQALEWWLAHHLALDINIFITFSFDRPDKAEITSILNIIAERYRVTILEMDETNDDPETYFHQTAKEKKFSFALRLALDEFFIPNLLENPADLIEQQHYPCLKLPYRHCGLQKNPPEHILNFGLNPRKYYTKMTDGDFIADSEGRFLYGLTENQNPFTDDMRKGAILHDAAASSLSKEARHFFDQGTVTIPTASLPAKADTITALIWQDVLRHFLVTAKRFPDWLSFPPQKISWHFLQLQPDALLGIDHATQKLRAVPLSKGENYSRLILGLTDSSADHKIGWLCLLDPTPFPFLPFDRLNARAPAVAVHVRQTEQTCRLVIDFADHPVSCGAEDVFQLLPFSDEKLPYALAALEHLLQKGKQPGRNKSLLDGFSSPPVTALWAVMTQSDFYPQRESFSLFSLLKALLTDRFPAALHDRAEH